MRTRRINLETKNIPFLTFVTFLSGFSNINAFLNSSKALAKANMNEISLSQFDAEINGTYLKSEADIKIKDKRTVSAGYLLITHIRNKGIVKSFKSITESSMSADEAKNYASKVVVEDKNQNIKPYSNYCQHPFNRILRQATMVVDLFNFLSFLK